MFASAIFHSPPVYLKDRHECMHTVSFMFQTNAIPDDHFKWLDLTSYLSANIDDDMYDTIKDWQLHEEGRYQGVLARAERPIDAGDWLMIQKDSAKLQSFIVMTAKTFSPVPWKKNQPFL